MLIICKKGLNNSLWNLIRLHSFLIINFDINCLKESIHVIEFWVLFNEPTLTKKCDNIFQIWFIFILFLFKKILFSAVSTIFSKKKVLVIPLSINSFRAISHKDWINSIKVSLSKLYALLKIFS